MKKFSLVSLFLLLSSIVISYSCSNELEDVGSTSAEGRMVTITTRSATAAEIEYPITLYAFRNSDGRLVNSVTANSSSDFQMLLPEGGYKIVAMAGTRGLTLPTNPLLTTDIGVPTVGLIDSPLQIGRADVSVSNTVSDVVINMTYQVAQVNLTLTDIPENITSVSVSFSSMYESLTFNGTLSGSKTITMNLEKQSEGTWYAPVAYLLPGESTQLTLSISMNGATTTTYGYTHTTNLKAGTPYNLVGSYKGEFLVSGTISSEGWATTETIDFKFGPGAEEDNEGEGDEGDDSDASDDIYIVNTIPSEYSDWNGHVVVDVTSTSSDNSSADLLLMSLQEWTGGLEVLRGNITYEEGTTENNIQKEWHIPSKDELKRISIGLSSQNLTSINTILGNLGGVALTSSGKYICEDQSLYVIMVGDSTYPITNSNMNNTDYRLRLVKTVKVRLQSTEGQ